MQDEIGKSISAKIRIYTMLRILSVASNDKDPFLREGSLLAANMTLRATFPSSEAMVRL